MHFEVYESLDAATNVHQQAAHLPARPPRRTSARGLRDRRLRASRSATWPSVSLDSDSVFGDGYSLQLATVTGSVDEGYIATLNVPVYGRRVGDGLVRVPSALPAGEPAPDRRRAPRRARSAELGRAAVRRSTCTCRSARCAAATATSTPTPPRTSAATACPAPRGRRTPRPRSTRSGCARRVLGRRRRAGRDGLLRRRHADAAAARPTWARCWPRSTAEFGLAPGAEVTTEANPDSVDAVGPRGAARGGLHPDLVRHAVRRRRTCCAILDRTHDPLRVPAVVGWARAAGFEQVSLDLIYGTPGESLADWEASLDAALACAPDHVSAYSLIVEEGTALARRVAPRRAADARRGRPRRQVPARRRAARRRPGWAGTRCPTGPGTTRARCRHNLGYWTGADWWGVGPGAHSHVGGVRWWNVKHPAAYAERIAAGRQPGARAARCSTRRPGGSSGCCWSCGCATGCRVDVLDAAGRAAVDDLVGAGLLERSTASGWCSPRAGGCSPTPWCATCCPEPSASADQAQRQRVAVLLAVGRLDRRPGSGTPAPRRPPPGRRGITHDQAEADRDDRDQQRRRAVDQQRDLEVQRLDRVPAARTATRCRTVMHPMRTRRSRSSRRAKLVAERAPDAWLPLGMRPVLHRRHEHRRASAAAGQAVVTCGIGGALGPVIDGILR